MIASILCYVTMATTLNTATISANDDKIMHISYRIKEELPNGTLIGNLFKDVVELYRKFKLTALSLLHSVKQMRKFELNTYDADLKRVNQYFKLDQNTGNLFIQKSIDYETICPKGLVYPTISSPLASMSSSLNPKQLPTADFDNLNLKVNPKVNDECIIKLILFVSLNNSIDERWIPIIVHIDDANDNRPVFLEVTSPKWAGFFRIPVEENTPMGTQLPLVKAFDADSDLKNSEIIYKLQFDGTELFSLKTTGCFKEISSHGDKTMTRSTGIMNNLPCLVVTAPLDYETEPKNYFLQLLACESGFPQSECSSLPIKIEVIDKNDNAPKIIFPPNSYHVVNISENLPIGSVILKIEAVDKDSGENSRLTYSLTQNLFQKGIFINSNHGNNHNTSGASVDGNRDNQFSIDSENGEIRLTKSLNAYDTSQIEITYHVSDNGSPVHRISQTILFNILDVNNHAPSIEIKKVGCSKFTEQINEIHAAYTIESGSHLGFIIVSDGDLGRNGQVSCTHRLENYNDNWNRRYLNVFKINLVSNGQIANRYLYILQILRVDDEDIDQTLFTNVDRKNSVSRLLAASATMVITCRDHGIPLALTSSTSITITLSDTQETELCFEQASYQITVEESNHPMNSLLRPQLLDLVSGVRYSLHSRNDQFTDGSSSNSGCDQLEIDPITGEISAPNGVDREKATYISCIIKATEQGVYDDGGEVRHRTANAEILINITDINDNEPRLMAESLLYGFTIYEWDMYASAFSSNDDYDGADSSTEDSQPHMIGYLNAVDQDLGENGTVRYFLLQVTPEKNQKSIEMRQILNNEIINMTTTGITNYRNGNPRLKPPFHIDSNTGLISLPKGNHRLINREDVNIYTLQILIEDMGSPKKLTTVQNIKIHVTDVNDNPPIWLQAINVNRIQANKAILLYQLEPVWEINQNSPTELKSILRAIDFDYGDNARLEMYIIQPNSIYKEFIGMDKLSLPMNSLRLSIHGELQLDIDRLKENYEYCVFVRVQDQGIQRQLYTDAYFLLHLPIQTKNRLEIFTNSIYHQLNQSIGNYRMKPMNGNQSIPSSSSSLLYDNVDNLQFAGGLSKKGIVIVLIISITLVIILSIIIIFIIIFKIRKFKDQKIQATYHHHNNNTTTSNDGNHNNNNNNNVYMNDNQIMPNEFILPHENQYLNPFQNSNNCNGSQLMLSNNLTFTTGLTTATTVTNTTDNPYKYYNDEMSKKHGMQIMKSYKSQTSSCDVLLPNVYANSANSYDSNNISNQLSGYTTHTTTVTAITPVYTYNSNNDNNYYYYRDYNNVCQSEEWPTPNALKNQYAMPSDHYHQLTLPSRGVGGRGTISKMSRLTATTNNNNIYASSMNYSPYPVSIRRNYNQTLPRQF
uniref:Cadherin domain-containing protein n=1 Tax=Trichobilharzia regenti TaxID=157069 RepID=A0AA85IXU0_TRIRE|nr:unnamed protein product [Trichobilharzia regenti]